MQLGRTERATIKAALMWFLHRDQPFREAAASHFAMSSWPNLIWDSTGAHARAPEPRKCIPERMKT
jgi:hypothetical protein